MEEYSGRWSCRPLAGADEREDSAGSRMAFGGCFWRYG